MAINPHFNFHNSTPEQQLISNLVAESISMYGYNMYYIPRTITNKDPIYKEDTTSEYNGNFVIDMYIESVDGYQGDGQFLSKFGIEIRHQIVLTVAMKTWVATTDVLTGFPQSFERPLEGDLIYYDKDNKIFQIKKVDQYNTFYQAGALQSYRLTCELFEYSSETINSGIPVVDGIGDRLSLSTAEQGSVIGGIPVFDNTFNMNNPDIGEQTDNVELETEGDTLVDFTLDNPFSESF